MSRAPHPLWDSVRRILMEEWDPIGVRDMGVDDEYDAYVWRVISLVMSGKGCEDVADYLDWAANEHMAMPQPRELHLKLGELLVRLKPKDAE